MTQIIIKLRDFDVDKNKIDNSATIEKITDYAKKYWNCEEIAVEEE